MNLDWKKIGLIAMFVAAAVLFAFTLYWFFWRTLFPAKPAPTATTTATTVGQLPGTVTINGRTYITDANGLPTTEVTAPAGTGTTPTTITTVTAEAVGKDQAYFATTGDNGDFIYYNRSDGKFYRLAADGTTRAYSDKVFHDVSGVTWSNSRNQAVLEYPDGNKIVYDFTTNRQTTLSQHWQEFSFAPNDGNLAFKSMGLDPENRFLSVAKTDGTRAVTLEKIGGFENNFTANWSPNNQMVGYFTQAKDASRSEVYFIGQNNENFQVMVVEGLGFEGKWSPSGGQMLYSVYSPNNNYQPTLWISDATPNAIGNNRHSLSLDTWADKCSFNSGGDKIYCAVPTQMPYGAGLERSAADQVPDQIYEINLATGNQRLLALPSGNHTIGQIFSSSDSQAVYFQDQTNQRIYRVQVQ